MAMTLKLVKSGLWSRGDVLFCDRCGNKIDYGFHPLCGRCLAEDPSFIRPYEYGDEAYGTEAATTAPRCARCASSLEQGNRYHVCPACTRDHIDAGHRVGMTTFGALTPAAIEGASIAVHCSSCGCAQVMARRADATITIAYYVPGSKAAHQQPPKCAGTMGLLEAVKRVQGCRRHDWVLLEDTIRLNASLEDIDQIHAKLGSDFPLELDEDLATKLQLGSRIYWCSRCGAWADLVPRVRISVEVQPPEPPENSL